jgi:hypothetical protein
MAKKKTAAPPARATAKKPAAATVHTRRAPAPTTDDYRKELIRLVRRQLECAREGIITTPEWTATYGADIDQIEDCAYRAGEKHPVPILLRDLTRKPIEWSIFDSTPSPVMLGYPAPDVFHEREYRIKADEPNVRSRVNTLAAKIIPEWLERMDSREADINSDDFAPAAWFHVVGIHAVRLRKWHQLDKIDIQKHGRINHYHIDTALKKQNVDIASGRQKCAEAWSKRHAENKNK